LAAGILLAACQSEATPAGAPGAAASGASSAGAARAMPTPLPTRVVAPTASIAVNGELALATPMVSATFDEAGKVAAVHVVVGQSVKKGDVLAELESASLTTALETAREALTLKQLQIDKSLTPATDAELASARAALNAAYAAYNAVKQGASSHDVEAALRNWNQAKNALYAAQLSRDQACERKENTCEQQQLSVQSAEINVHTAYQAYLDAQAPASQNDLARAWSSVAQAKANLAALQNPASEAQQRIYDIQLQQARLAVARAERDLAGVRLVSPCDCVVESISLAVGASASAGSITLLDVSQIQFRVTDLTEQDVVKVKPGQAVTLRLKAFEQSFTGTVSAILPVSSGTQGALALYTALIDIDPAGVTLRPGMTGQAEIQLGNRAEE
jgi:HlyD family secretion protein